MNTFHEPERGSTLRIYRDQTLVVLHMTSPRDDGADGCYNMEAADARAMGQLLIDHADAIDKAAHDKHAAEVLERRNRVTRRYMNANWNDLSNRVTREMVDRIIELESQQEETK